MSVNVLIADDAELMRRAIRELLSGYEDISIVGEASNIADTLDKINELHPDVVVIDVSMTEKYAASLQSACNGSKLLAISFADDQQTGELADKIGASKLLDKMKLTEQLVPTIRQIALGGTP